jgi:hypothetical protein
MLVAAGWGPTALPNSAWYPEALQVITGSRSEVKRILVAMIPDFTSSVTLCLTAYSIAVHSCTLDYSEAPSGTAVN